MNHRIKIGVSIGLTCLMLIGCQQGIRDYIGAVGLTRVHADEINVCRSNSPSTSNFIEELGKRVRHALYASVREVYESGRVRETLTSDRSGDLGVDDVNAEGNVLPAEDVFDDGEYFEVAEADRGQEVTISPYSEPVEDYSENLTYLGEFTATAYCPGACCCGEYASGYTASGTLATEGRTIACNSLPFGTQVLIDGHVYTVEDTGWSPYGENWLDIFFASHDAALAYGMRTVDVYLIG